MSADRNYGTQMEQYIPHCLKCGETTFTLMPIKMSSEAAENWKLYAMVVMREARFCCYGCGTPVDVKELAFRRL